MTFLFKRIAITSLRPNFGTILDQASYSRARFIITRHAMAMAVLLGVAEFNGVLKKPLKKGAIRRSMRDRQLAEEWLSPEDEELIRRVTLMMVAVFGGFVGKADCSEAHIFLLM